MAIVIAEPCIGVKDGACVEVCPVDAIHPLPGEAGHADADQIFINASECICCNLCISECPVGAIFAEEDLPAEWRAFVEKNAEHYR